MPLLGRSKASSKRAQDEQQPAASCQSPLFGLRRQLQPNDNNNNNSGGRQQVAGSKDHQQQLKGCREELSSIPQQISREQVHYAFGMMDADCDGMIDLRDLSHMLANLGLPIDEAILAHLITSSVSKRGDRRISEAEFFDWLSQFIEITTGAGSRPSRAQGSPKSSALKEQQQQQHHQASTSSSFGGKLVAQPDDQQATWFSRGRRGSGSGLALMRSLSGSSLTGSNKGAGLAAAAGDAGGNQATGTGQSPASFNSSPDLATPTGATKRRPSVAKSSSSSKGEPVASPATSRRQDDQDEARNDLKAAFCVFDLDGDGYITLDEVQSGLKLIGESWTQTEIRQLFRANNKTFIPNPTAATAAATTKRSTSKTRNQSVAATQDLNSKRISIDEFVSLLL